MDLPELADLLSLDIDDLFPVIEVLEILRFAKVSEGDIALTDSGKAFANADILDSKKIFLEHLVKHVPLAKHIRDVLDKKSKHRISQAYFLDELEEHLSDKEAGRVFKVVIEWGRYAELFAYDVNSGELSLENPD
jgi:NitT/TauT family transport system ATP-binding protein